MRPKGKRLLGVWKEKERVSQKPETHQGFLKS
jgi:hypothetical protein